MTENGAGPVVRTTHEGNVATVVLDRPPVNALDRQALREIAEAFEALAEERVSVAVFRTGGERAFIAGADLKEIDAAVATGPQNLTDRGLVGRRALEAVGRCAVPVVAVVDGAAIGGGLSFAALADIVVATEDARFGTTEINVGLLGASAHLRRLVGGVRAREMYLTGRLVAAPELHAWGAIAHCVPRADLEATVDRVVGELAAKSPLALRLAKEALDRTESLPVHEGYRIEQDYTNRLMALEDSAEARRAFFEKREPTWAWR
jgi:enoyl-CoA hydratase